MSKETSINPDRRVRRTRSMLRAALIELILDRGFDAITVQDITDRANLARATFYLHYSDKEDLLSHCLNEVYAELERRITQANSQVFEDGSTSLACVLFQHAVENTKLYHIILHGHGQGLILHRIRSCLAERITNQLGALLARREGPALPEVMAHHLTGALLGLLAWWLDRGQPHTPGEMAHLFRQIGQPGAQAASGWGNH